MDFWDRTKELIEKENTSFAYIAGKLGKAESTVSGWHREKIRKIPRADFAVIIAEILKTTVEYLVTGIPPAGLSIEAMEIAQKFNNLSPAGQKAAQSMMEGLLQDYPRQPIQAENSAG
jgi:transcriptional regulator with XRE-family HTH domain